MDKEEDDYCQINFLFLIRGGGGGGALPYKGLTGTCGPTGYGFQDFCLERGIYFTPFCLKRGIFTWTNVLNRISKYVYFIGT